MTNPDEIGSRLDEAIAWRIRLSADDTSDADWQAFALWLEADASNRQLFNQVEDMDDRLEAALSAAAQEEPATTGTLRPIRLDSSRRPRVRTWAATGGLIAASLVVAAVLWGPMPAAVTYATRAGEMQTVRLPDSTTLEIGARTKLVAQVDKAHRRVNLIDGDVIFRVAKDTQHPFVVQVGRLDVRVVGTVFDLSHNDGITILSVAEGTVVVSSDADTAGSRGTTVISGEQLVHDDKSGTTTLEKANPADAMAWHNGYLVYRNAPLSRVIADLNRYFAAPIASGSDDVGSLRFSGVLRLDSEEAILKRISTFLPVQVFKSPGGGIVLRAAKSKP